jgi:hypothetical protein
MAPWRSRDPIVAPPPATAALGHLPVPGQAAWLRRGSGRGFNRSGACGSGIMPLTSSGRSAAGAMLTGREVSLGDGCAAVRDGEIG